MDWQGVFSRISWVCLSQRNCWMVWYFFPIHTSRDFPWCDGTGICKSSKRYFNRSQIAQETAKIGKFSAHLVGPTYFLCRFQAFLIIKRESISVSILLWSREIMFHSVVHTFWMIKTRDADLKSLQALELTIQNEFIATTKDVTSLSETTFLVLSSLSPRRINCQCLKVMYSLLCWN